MNSSLLDKNILFFGAGSMAEAIIRGIVRGNVAEPEQIYALNRSNLEQREKLTAEYGIHAGGVDEAEAYIRNSDIIVLGMKPKDAAGAVAGIRSWLRDDQLIVSLIAGMSIKTIRELVKTPVPVVRTMPNTSSTIGLGATGMAFSDDVSEAQRELAAAVFRAIGIVQTVEERLLDIVTGVSGSGPAYVYYLMEAMIAGGVSGGLSPEASRQLTVQTVLGAASMVQATGEEPAELRRKVTSPNGTTQAALETLDAGGFQESVKRAVLRAAERADELGTMIGSEAAKHT